MFMQRKILARLAAIGLLLVCAQLPAQTNEERTRSQLEALKRDMETLGNKLQEDIEQRDTLQAALRQSEIVIGDISLDIGKTREKLGQVRGRLLDLGRQKQAQLVARNEQQEQISAEIKTAYQMGKQGQLKILLSQERPDTLSRSMAYYEYFYTARQREVARYLSVIERIEVLESQISSTVNELEATETTLTQQQSQLVEGQENRERDLANLEADIASKDERLRRMNRNREELEQLLKFIEEANADMEAPRELETFAALKGQMPWPIPGQPSNRFGRKRSPGNQRWQGLLIPAPEGDNVRAIHHGRVVFADWFRGSGLLLIIDHGDGFMSLYAHNQSLLREVGEWVNTGAAIAVVGNSGGQQNPALYFEIRDKGKPVNPAHWLAKARG